MTEKLCEFLHCVKYSRDIEAQQGQKVAKNPTVFKGQPYKTFRSVWTTVEAEKKDQKMRSKISLRFFFHLFL